jgi:hypothetical protein
VREEANTLLLDTALGAFEGTQEKDSLAALAAVAEAKDLAAIAKEAAAEKVAMAALARVEDEKAVGWVARRSIHATVRMAALGRVNDPAEVGTIALRSDFKDVALAALERISDRETLEMIAARGKNRAAARQARGVVRSLPALSQPAAVPAAPPTPVTLPEPVVLSPADQEADLCRQAEAVAESASWFEAPGRLVAIEAAWEDVRTDDAAIADRFAAARDRVHALVAAHEVEQADRARAAEALHADVAYRTALCEQVEELRSHFEAPVAPQEGERLTGAPSDQQVRMDEAARRLEALVAEWQQLPSLPVEFAGRVALVRRFEDARAECQRRYEQATTLRARRIRLGALSEAAESIAGFENLADARTRWSALRQEWSATVGSGSADEDLAARFNAADARMRAREQEVREERTRQERENLARVTQAVDHLAALAQSEKLTLKDANRGARDLRTLIGNLGPMPSRRDREETTDRLKSIQVGLLARLQEIKDADEWQRWANANVQEELCKQAEGLVDVEDTAEAARQLRDLQAQWKKVSAVPREQSQALWLRFKAAQERIRERTDQYFAQQAEERAGNLQKKEALCQKAEALAESTDWIKTAEIIKQLQAEWTTIGPVSRGQEKAVWERFRAANDRFFTRRRDDLTRRKEEWSKNFARREALIARVEALSSPEDWDKASDEIKRLQAEWRTIGPVRKKHADGLAERLQQALARFYERFAQRDELQMAANVAARETICADLEALLPAGTDEAAAPSEAPADVPGHLREAWTRWAQAGAVPTEALASLTERFRNALAAVVSAYPQAVEGSEFDTASNLRKMEELCARVEELLPAQPAGVPADQSPAAILATRWREALASNTIGGASSTANEEARRRAAVDTVRDAQVAWKRIGPVPEDLARPLAARFQKACNRFFEQRGGRPAGGPPRPGRR